MEFMSKRINYFIAVAEEGSINKAACRLCITPSPLSQRIKELEEELSTELFERSAQGLALTKDGVELYNNVIPHYDELNKLKYNEKAGKKIHIAVYGPTPSHAYTAIDYILMRKKSAIIKFERLKHEEGRRYFCHRMFDFLFSTEPLLPSPYTQCLHLEERLQLLFPLYSKPKEYMKLPFVQSTYFSETPGFKYYHAKLQLNGFSRELMQVDDTSLRIEFIRNEKAISLDLESMSSFGVTCAKIIVPDAVITHHIYSNVIQPDELNNFLTYLSKKSMQPWRNHTHHLSNG